MRILMIGEVGFVGRDIKRGDTVLCLDNFINGKQGVDGGGPRIKKRFWIRRMR